MDILSSEIYQDFKQQGLIIGHSGTDNRVTGIVPAEAAGQGDLVFVEHEKYLSDVLESGVAAIVTTQAIAATIQLDNTAILLAPNVRMAMAYIRQKYVDRDVYHSEWGRIHVSAVMHESVLVPDDAVIGPGVVIGENVQLGAAVVIMANTVIEFDAVIGARTVIYPSCVVSYDCHIGEDCILKAGCVIGSDGQGFAQDEQFHHHRIPQTGRVVIGNKVVIGSVTTIDRATYTETKVHDGCIVDAQCHLAHNVIIEEDCILVAQTGIAGSSHFGKRVIASGQTGILDHVHIPDDTMLLHRAGVHSSIKKSGIYAYGPAQPFKKYTKNIAVFQRLSEVWTRLKRLEKQVAELSK
ncbi:UDP-3-O-[3-hydroxymyristoyl] glucosamine N-acyltransferase [Bathymodiolus platifrons methanotrophic gill symbiont]|uniref:UDP-3-O-(3-hydroxymyristoyl)glucosamine N-acyltransferase n=1 Tax=Bathymodiolus platifrons methanotrophic gill symbiont TaxID=113268 RepID=UPI000B41791F|nr:UDP-3-O-(3-hydroxymyristoyl)glucosamine N-acyltransferase [Bathymodiolus platifrons methanotrophic gill symbiont]MCK5869541.1 UDP-3-O-(3-hydroxymyristoyl)glucosamine N-acyltransferase [Methyloprofundus sp.]TXK98573.1 UDP-3-O-(3-hydroxymyristoyl)glucosamine N-acyltransferase [Methylococcaceae bacterium CS4]TXL00548.1 UDP-3-O-(3-hydroxymyristoyl)glucosamine N-acyltransferase [Methylococcaceae bacterium CS5]TXL01588.1 UDP-3-O-(3-hydroxymyristoyl)glucosamine N-acyltransferase [Methylococcaceae b